MNLIDLLGQAHGGNAMSNLGSQFGLDADQAEQAVRQLLPVISSGLKRNTRDQDGLSALVNALDQGDHEQYYNRFDSAAMPQMRAMGDGILGHILGSKDVSRAAADRASAGTGIGAAILKQMLPVIASMVMGALANRTKQPEFRKSVGSTFDIPSLGGGSSGSSGAGGGGGGILGSILGSVLSGATSGSRRGGISGADIFGSLLDADGDGSMADDLLDIAGKMMRR